MSQLPHKNSSTSVGFCVQLQKKDFISISRCSRGYCKKCPLKKSQERSCHCLARTRREKVRKAKRNISAYCQTAVQRLKCQMVYHMIVKNIERFSIECRKLLGNRPFATNDHMVQNPPCWRASSLLFPHWDIKTKTSQAWITGTPSSV